MRAMLFAAALAAGISPALAADVGVSVSIGEPGFYGRIDIGGYPQPQVIYREPVVVERVPLDRPPVYLRVPPGHAKHWRKHCHEYHACGERVFFVKDDWYNREYVPHYRELHRDRFDERRGERRDDRRRDHKKDKRRGDDRDRDRDRDR